MSKTLVVRASDLSKVKDGFTPVRVNDAVMEVIAKNAFWEERNEELEENTSLRQLIVYSVIVNPVERTVFVYERADKGCDEARLRKKFSCGVGGHVKEADGKAFPLIASFFREIKEEVGLRVYLSDFQPIGYISKSKLPIDKVHLGILNIFYTTRLRLSPTSEELKSGSMVSFAEACRIFDDERNNVEEWSKIALPVVLKKIGR